MGKLVFCSATAGDRFDQALCLFRSIRKWYPKMPCRFDAIDCSKKQVKQLEAEGVVVENYSWDDLPPMFADNWDRLQGLTDKHEKEKGYIAYTPQSLVCAAWRLFQMPRLMNELDMPLMWLDSDCIVRGKINSFIDTSLAHDYAVHYRPKNKDLSKVLSSVFVINNTKKGKKYCSLLEPTYLEVFEEVAWWADPYTLFLAIKRSGVDYWNFPAKNYNDSDLSNKAKIWHAKHGGINKPKWKKEVKKYIK